MESVLHEIAHHIAIAIEVIAICHHRIWCARSVDRHRVACGSRDATSDDRRIIWMNFGRWLVAGLTFQLAADLVGTSFEPTWDEIGHLAAIAAIRTFLSYFLDRETEDARERIKRGRAYVGMTHDRPGVLLRILVLGVADDRDRRDACSHRRIAAQARQSRSVSSSRAVRGSVRATATDDSVVRQRCQSRQDGIAFNH